MIPSVYRVSKNKIDKERNKAEKGIDRQQGCPHRHGKISSTLYSNATRSLA
ncbi:MAG: hypothetical protein ACJ703_04995 [Nitrososphaera sp.]